MCSGTSSVGSATMSSGNSGKASTALLGMELPRSAGGPVRRDDQVVEHGGRQPALEHATVDLLEDEVAPVGVLAPQPRNLGGLGARLEHAVGPPEPVRQQL